MTEPTLVTIHGFWSSSATWDRLTTVWSADEHFRSLRIHHFEYRSPRKPRIPFSPSRIPDYDDIAQTFATEYMVKIADTENVAIVTHSQGGLILQRFLTWMLQQGRGRELSRIASVIMLACPNSGSDYLRSLRNAFRYHRHPQASSLEMLDKRVAETQRMVLQRIVNTIQVDSHQCHIPIHVYAGDSDRIVSAASAQAAFPGASTLAGNHFSILDPEAPGNNTAGTVRFHVLKDLRTRWATEIGSEKQSPINPAREQDVTNPVPPENFRSDKESKLEGPFTQSGNISIQGKYAAGHDIKFVDCGNDEDKG